MKFSANQIIVTCFSLFDIIWPEINEPSPWSLPVGCNSIKFQQQDTEENRFLTKDKKFESNETRLFTVLQNRQVISCLKKLHIDSSRTWLHFAFIGDSRIRQQCFNLLKVTYMQLKFNYYIPQTRSLINLLLFWFYFIIKLIPDGDRQINPNVNFSYHN